MKDPIMIIFWIPANVGRTTDKSGTSVGFGIVWLIW